MLGVEVDRWRSKQLDGTRFAPSSEEYPKEVKMCGCDGLPSLEIYLKSVELYPDTKQHTTEPYWGPPIEWT